MKTKVLTAVFILGGLAVSAGRVHACDSTNPVAVLFADPAYIMKDSNDIILDGSGSYDPGNTGIHINGIKKFEWDFDYQGPATFDPAYFTPDYNETPDCNTDGVSDGNCTNIASYSEPGAYRVMMRVTDDANWTDTADCYVYVNRKISVPDDINNIQDAIYAADPCGGTIITVAPGTYYEAIDFNGVPCTVTSTDPNDPFVVAATIIDGNGAYHVVKFDTHEDGNSVLTGFTITGGDADSTYWNRYGGGIFCYQASPTISDCVVTNNAAENKGGGMATFEGSPVVRNCIFFNNRAAWTSVPGTTKGGGMFNYDSSAVITNCVFVKNTARAYGGAMFNWYSSPIITNCTFTGNSASCGGGISNSHASPTLTNCILWGNTATTYGPNEICNEIYNDVSDPNLRYCDIKGCKAGGEWDPDTGVDGGGNLDGWPRFINDSDPCGPDSVFGTFDDGTRLQILSICIDAADGNEAPQTDIAGHARVDIPYVSEHNGVGEPNYVDIGAYETPTIWFVDDDAGGSGTSWEDAFADLQDALSAANSVDRDEIWVAEGTYEPNATDRSKSFVLVGNVGVYGGFAGTEVARHQRDWLSYEAILSGDINQPGDANDNSYHVVKGTDNGILDGFTITGGNANGSGADGRGGGISCVGVSPTIRNCTIAGNISSDFGGGMYNQRPCSPIVADCFFYDNSSTSGGGVSNYSYPAHGCSATFINCAFSGNQASWGGAMLELGSLSTIISCTFAGNEALYNGGAMYNCVNADPTVTNSIFWADTPEEIYNYDVDSCPIFSYCNIQGWDPNVGTGNTNSDPCLGDVNNPAGYDGIFKTYDDGLRLSPSSPCIDAADGNSAPLKDIVGLERVDINNVDHNGVGEPNYADRGAYESYSGYGDDSDNDGLSDIEEELLGTNPDSNDSDGDLVLDANEFNVHRTNPSAEDTDGDGLSDYDEIYTYGTSPLLIDTDKDGMDDAWELSWDLHDPLNPDDADDDPDGDDRDNLTEYNDGTNPLVYTTISVTVYEYDNAGQLTKETIQHENGNDVAVTQYKYDEAGRRWQERRWASAGGPDDANDMITLYSYDTRNNAKKTVRKAQIEDPNVNGIDPNDLVTERFYDLLGRLTDVNDANGGNTHYTYHEGGRLYEAKDQLGNLTRHYYDNAGRLKKTVDHLGHYVLNHHDSLGRTVKRIAFDSGDNKLMQTRLEYDGMGHVIRRAVMADADSSASIDPNIGMVTEYTYDSNTGNYPGLLASQTVYYGGSPCQSAITYYEYDGLGRLTKTTDPALSKTILDYDAASRIIYRQQIDDNPLASEPNLVITTEYVYDSLGRLYQQIAEPNVDDSNTWHVTSYLYDALGNREYEIKPNTRVIAYTYDALSRLTQKIADYNAADGINQKTDYAYDRLGRQTSITGYADGSTAQKTEYTYNALDLITKVAYPDGNAIDFEYNAAAKVVRRNDQRGIVTTYSYDGVYNMTQKLVNGNGVTEDANETFTYDGLARMLTAVKEVNDSEVSYTIFTYNGFGKVAEANETYFADSSTNKTIEYTCDQTGHPNSVTYPYPGSLVINVARDWRGRIDTINLLGYDRVMYKYVGSRVAQRKYYTTFHVNYEPTYDNLGRITSAHTYWGPNKTAKFDYEYQPYTNNISKQTYVHRPNDPCTDFSYDNLDRLTIAEYGILDNNQVFTMDDLGNRTKVNEHDGADVNYVVDNLTNRYDSVGANSLTYNEAGDLIQDRDDYNYEYDYENRIVKITKDSNDIAEFAYDALGRRIEKKDLVDSNNTRRYYYNNNWQVLSEYDGSNSFKRFYVYGNYIDEVLISADFALTSRLRYYAHDHLYSPVAVLKYYGVPLERYEYDAYGDCRILEPNFAPDPDGKTDYNNFYLFTGRRVDILDNGSLKIQYSRNRYYDYYTGRWLSHDPLGIALNAQESNQLGAHRRYHVRSGRLHRNQLVITPNTQEPRKFDVLAQYEDGTSLYQYVWSNPVAHADPHGLKIEKFVDCRNIDKTKIQEAHDAVEARVPFLRNEYKKFTFEWVKQNYVVPYNRKITFWSKHRYRGHNEGMKGTLLEMHMCLHGGITVECECRPNPRCRRQGGVAAYTTGWSELWNKIHFCPRFQTQTLEQRTKAFMHELSHLAAYTVDALVVDVGDADNPKNAYRSSDYIEGLAITDDIAHEERVWIWTHIFPP
jgi:YD repeat-containing protein